MSSEFSATIAGYDETKAVLCSPDGQIFYVPLSLLPVGLSPGNIVNVSFSINRTEEHRRRNELNKV